MFGVLCDGFGKVECYGVDGGMWVGLDFYIDYMVVWWVV